MPTEYDSAMQNSPVTISVKILFLKRTNEIVIKAAVMNAIRGMLNFGEMKDPVNMQIKLSRINTGMTMAVP